MPRKKKNDNEGVVTSAQADFPIGANPGTPTTGKRPYKKRAWSRRKGAVSVDRGIENEAPTYIYDKNHRKIGFLF